MRRAEPAAIGTTWRSYVAEGPAWGIVAGALAVSFWTQVDEVQRHGFAVWEPSARARDKLRLGARIDPATRWTGSWWTWPGSA